MRQVLACLLSSVFICGSVAPAQPTSRPDDLDEPENSQPDEIRRGMRMGDPPETRYRRYWENLVARIEPTRQGDPARAAVYLDFYRREILRDPRLFATNLRLSPVGGEIVIDGAAEYKEQLDALLSLLRALNLDARADAVALMPTTRVADQPFGILRAPRSFLGSTPTGGENVNEALGGEPVWILDAADESLLCHSIDGYVGWIRSDDIERVSAERITSAINARGPLHAEKIEAAIANASARLGKPYIWGGRSDEGVDCSGLVQQAFASQGVHLPRDAEQQALVGKLVATRWHRDALRRGDLLYFLGRRGFIAHTAIYLGDGKLIESADGKVRVSEFRPGLPRWEAFCFAKRVLD